MDYKRFAKPYEWQGATLWYMPYRTPHVDIVTRALNDLVPEIEYVNSKTGERVMEAPEVLVQEREKVAKKRAALLERWAGLNAVPDEARLASIVVKSDWKSERKWNIFHDTFALALPLIVGIDPPEDAAVSTELQTFMVFWNDKSGTFQERWETFQMIIGTDTMTALWNGVTATRDNPAPAKAVFGQVEPKDPKDAPTGDVSELATTSL